MSSDTGTRPDPDTLATILSEMASGLALLGREGRFRYLNPAAMEFFRDFLEDDEVRVIGRTWSSLLPHLEGTEHAEAFRAVVRGRADHVDLQSLRSPRGRYWDISLHALDDGAFATFRNVTESVLRAESLDAFFRHYSSGAFVVFDEDLVYTYVGGGGFEHLDISPEDLVGRSLQELWEPPVVQALEPLLRAALEGEVGDARVEYAEREYHCWASPLPDAPDGSRRGMLLTQEVSESVLYQQELSLVRQAVAAVDIGVSIADARAPDHPLIFLNEGFTRVTGYEVDEVLGRNCRFLQGPDTDPDDVAALREAVEAGESVQRSILNYRKDGSPFWNRLTINPVRDEDGTVTHFIGIQEDVTERRRMGEQLAMSNRLNSVGRLAGGIAHDMRNVLAGAKALLQLTLGREDLPDEVVEDLEEAETVLSRGESVTSQLLVFAREQPMETSVVEISRLVRDRASFLSRFLRDDIEVVAHADERTHVAVDLGRLDQVLFNLATNAEQAMPDGGRLTFRVRSADTEDLPAPTRPFDPPPGRSWVVLTVADTGVGMDEETRARAFEPFFTGRESEGGTGLGLASVFGTMEQLRGGAWIHSRPGEGTRVHLAFPAAEAEEDEGSEPTAQAFELETRPLTILLAEDDATLRRTLSKALGREGHHVLPAADGTSARAVLEAQGDQLDVIVSDVMMPGFSGVELVREARKLRPGLPALLISGYSNEDLGSLGEGVRFLSKPFDLEVALGIISALTYGRR